MTKLFNEIKSFYRSSWDTLKLFDLAMTSSNVAMSVSTGQIELSHFDGYMNRKKTIAVPDRLEAAETLKLLADELANRIQSLSPEQVQELDRVQKVLTFRAELPKRLDDPNL